MDNLLPAGSADLFDLTEFLLRSDLTVRGLGEPGVRLWVLRDERGGVRGSTGFELSDDGAHALVRSVAVDPGLQRQGLGARLARCALARAQDEGARRAWLFSRRSGPFWQQLGFVEADRDELAGVLSTATQVALFHETGQLAREVAWSRPLDAVKPK